MNTKNLGGTDLLSIFLSDGGRVCFSPNHKIRTADGIWVEAAQLKPGTRLFGGAVIVELYEYTEDDETITKRY